MLAVTRFTPLLVNLESMTSKPNAGGSSNNCVAWKVEKAVHYFVNHRFFKELGNIAAVVEGCLIWDVAQPVYKLQCKFLNTF